MFLWICLRWPESEEAPVGQRLALAMLQYSPKVAHFRKNSVVLEVAASLSLFGGIRRLYRRIHATGVSVHPSIQLGMAPSATGAWLLAGTANPTQGRVLSRRRLKQRLATLPFHHLPETHPYQLWLENIGCRYLSCLRALPRQGLQQRSSPALLHALDCAYAQIDESLSWYLPPDEFRLKHETDFHLLQADAIQAASQPLLHALCGWLHGRQAALHEFSVLLHHEKGRHASPPTPVVLRFSAASWDIDDFNRLLKERLAHCRLHRRVIAIDLGAGPPHPRAPANDTLFPDPARRIQDESRLFDLLAARLGPASIRRPNPQPPHLPEASNVWSFGLTSEPVSATTRPPTVQPPAWLNAKPRPFWLLPEPQPLLIRQERPVYQGRALRMVQGPERIETGWWTPEGHQRRDYFVAEDSEGARYWVYRERETGEGWFLHGLFG